MKKQSYKNGAGFTVTEVMITIGIFGMILAMPTIFLWGIGRSDALSSTTQEVVGVMHEAQADTIAGRSLDGSQPSSYGVHFESNYYVYFRGISYNGSDSNNRRTDLPVGLTFSQIQLPGNNVIFEQVTGKVFGFNPSQNFIDVADTNTGQTRRITVSKFGGIGYE